MSDEYAAVKRGKLILKGEKPKAKKRKHKKKEKAEDEKVDEDCVKHGGWWKVEKIEDVSGSIAIEFGRNTYILALDNGLFTIGAPHSDGEGPSPEEIFTAFPAGDNKFALKSGYGKYLGVSKDGVVTGRSDAVGPMEQWEPVWQDNRFSKIKEESLHILDFSLIQCFYIVSSSYFQNLIFRSSNPSGNRISLKNMGTPLHRAMLSLSYIYIPSVNHL